MTIASEFTQPAQFALALGCLQGQFGLLSVGTLVAAGEARLGRYCHLLSPSISSAGAVCSVAEQQFTQV